MIKELRISSSLKMQINHHNPKEVALGGLVAFKPGLFLHARTLALCLFCKDSPGFWSQVMDAW